MPRLIKSVFPSPSSGLHPELRKQPKEERRVYSSIHTSLPPSSIPPGLGARNGWGGLGKELANLLLK